MRVTLVKSIEVWRIAAAAALVGALLGFSVGRLTCPNIFEQNLEYLRQMSAQAPAR